MACQGEEALLTQDGKRRNDSNDWLHVCSHLKHCVCQTVAAKVIQTVKEQLPSSWLCFPLHTCTLFAQVIVRMYVCLHHTSISMEGMVVMQCVYTHPIAPLPVAV